MGDSEFQVNLTFFEKSIEESEKIEIGDVIALKNVLINAYKLDVNVRPGNLNFKDLHPPYTEIEILK